MYFLLTRPQADSLKQARNLIARGHRVRMCPMLTIRYNPVDVGYQKNIPADCQALLFTSANGVRAAVHQGIGPKTKPGIACYAVGPMTGAVAKAAGFDPVFVAGGDGQALARLVSEICVPEKGPLVHIAGHDVAGHVAGTLRQQGFDMREMPLYKAVKTAHLDPETCALIKGGAITHVPFYSPRTAQTFIDLVKQAALQACMAKITALCLSPAVADVVSSLYWRKSLFMDLKNR